MRGRVVFGTSGRLARTVVKAMRLAERLMAVIDRRYLLITRLALSLALSIPERLSKLPILPLTFVPEIFQHRPGQVIPHRTGS
jgi:hypothetical protein